MKRTQESRVEELAVLKMRSEISELSNDTTLEPHNAAVYLGISTKKLEAMRSAVQPSGPPFIKMVDKTSKARNQSVFYKLGDLRKYQDEFRVHSSHEASLKTSIYQFTRVAHTFYAEKRTGTLLCGVDGLTTSAERDEYFLKFLQQKISVRRLTLLDAVHSEWRDSKRHSKIRRVWKSILEQELRSIRD